MLISQLNADDLTDSQRTELVFKNVADDTSPGECIFVFGSKSSLKYRVPKAVALYNAGRANRILFSGGATWEEYGFPEAIVMRNAAIQLGVAERDILVETESTNTKENVLASLMVLDREFQLHKLRRLLIVTTTFHMKRTYLTLKTYMPKWIEFSLCPVDDRTTREDNWWLHQSGANRVRNECRKIIEYVRDGYLLDDHV